MVISFCSYLFLQLFAYLFGFAEYWRAPIMEGILLVPDDSQS